MPNSALENMVKQQLRTCGILDEKLLAAFRSFPREQFVPAVYANVAYADELIPLGHGQHMMLPLQEAQMLQVLRLTGKEKVLEIGTGSGYVTALLAHLSHHVFSVDIFSEFTGAAASKLAAHDIRNVTLASDDAALGWDKHTPYDVIVITGALPFLPQAFKDMLKAGGRIFAILGTASVMRAHLFEHCVDKDDGWKVDVLFDTQIKPLINAPQLETFTF